MDDSNLPIQNFVVTHSTSSPAIKWTISRSPYFNDSIVSNIEKCFPEVSKDSRYILMDGSKIPLEQAMKKEIIIQELIEQDVEGDKKYLTAIHGLQRYGIEPGAVLVKLRRRFRDDHCYLDYNGEITILIRAYKWVEDIAEMLGSDPWNVPQQSIYFIIDNKKVPATTVGQRPILRNIPRPKGICAICGKIIDSPQDMKKHWNSCHKDILKKCPTIFCSYCGNHFLGDHYFYEIHFNDEKKCCLSWIPEFEAWEKATKRAVRRGRDGH